MASGVIGPTETEAAALQRKSLALWVTYDVASSAYVYMIPAFAYAAYFRSYVTDGGPYADAIWAVVVAMSLLIAGVVAPLVGAVADAAAGRRVILVGSTVACCLATAMLATVGKGEVFLGALYFVVAHVGYLIAAGIYDSFLPLISDRRRAAITSGLGWSIGYFGGIAAFVLCLPFIRGGLGEEDISNFRMVFIITAGFFFVVSLPTLIYLPHAGIRGDGGAAVDRPYRSAYARVWSTITSWRNNREAFKFLFAYYLINDGVVTVLYFCVIFFMTTFGLPLERVLWLTLLFHVIAIPSTAFFGWLGGHWSERGALYVTLAIWIAVLMIMAFATQPFVPLLLAFLIGLVLGSTQALCRSLYAGMIPTERTSEFFGFNALAGRASAAFGPLLFGAVSTVTGSQRMAMLSLAIFIVAGGLILSGVCIPEREEPQPRVLNRNSATGGNGWLHLCRTSSQLE